APDRPGQKECHRSIVFPAARAAHYKEKAMETSPTHRPRRRLIAAASASATCAISPAAARAAPYPERPINSIVPFAPGGGTDISARSSAAASGDKSAASVVVDNRPGAGGQIAADSVARAN
ncbi:hypothetical protein OY671_012832, partial [Metschnikowia pulcherrima]